MKTKWFESIRWKFLLAFVLSGSMGALIAALLVTVAYRFRNTILLGDLLRFLYLSVGQVPVIVLTGLVLFLICFFVLTTGIVRRIAELNRAVHEIAQGRLDTVVPVRAEDELGNLARNLGLMARQLSASLEEERKAQQAKHELITSVSHDLRTPLTAVLGYLELAEHDKYRDEVELRHYVGVAYAKSLQLKRLIDQLFEFTRTSHGGIRLNPAEVNLCELLEQLAEEFVPALQEAGMEYRLVLPDDRVMAAVDPDLMVRVLENLLTNAIRYGREGKRVDLELEGGPAGPVIRVANYGEPIPDRDLPHLFETFYRVEKSRAEATGGAGLGLAIARNIVLLHGGSISAYNEPNRAVFAVQLPALRKA